MCKHLMHILTYALLQRVRIDDNSNSITEISSNEMTRISQLDFKFADLNFI